MKYFKFVIIVFALMLTSCSAIKVSTDYDAQVDFSKFNTFAFYKPGIDKADISDLDKKRVLRAIEAELLLQGFMKSDNPNMLVSFFTKSRERVNVNQNQNNMGFGWGMGWNPWMMGGMNNNNVNVSQFTEGTLFIDFIDTEKKELVWQGIGTGALKIENREKKEARIKEFVKEIISRFPPEKEKK
jgi:CRISPR/Cas system CSM-associated protein Csm5 (group 7 of RAMP superfamily)